MTVSKRDLFKTFLSRKEAYLLYLAKEETDETLLPLPLTGSEEVLYDYSLNAEPSGSADAAERATIAATSAAASASLAEDWAVKMDGKVDTNSYSAKYCAEIAKTGPQAVEDSTEAYVKTVPAGNVHYASLEQIGGKTLVWNQLIYDPTMTDASNWKANAGTENFTITANNNILKVARDAGTTSLLIVNSVNAITSVATHKYYISAYIGGDVSRTVRLYVGSGYSNVSVDTTLAQYSTIVTATSNGVIGIQVTSANLAVGGYIEISNFVCVDLTLMYGSGNEPSTVAEFQQDFPAVWYAYNPGSLLSAGVTEVVSQGRNIVDQDTILGAVYNAVKTDDYWQVATNQLYLKYRFNNYSSNASPIFTQTALTMSFDIKLDSSESSGSTLYYGFFKSNQSSATLNSVSFTSTWQRVSVSINDNVECKIAFSYASALKVNIRNFQIQVGTSATDYSPYHAPIQYPIPASIQALEGYGWSAGSVYNYIDYERKVFVKRVGKVVLDGTQDIESANWRPSANGVGWYYKYNVTNNKVFGNGELPNIVSTKYLAQKRADLLLENEGIGVYINNSFGLMIWQKDTTLDNTTAINTYLSANPITVYYEMDTPQETDISAYITDDNLIEVEAGGTLTFPNSNGDDYRIPVPSAETYWVIDWEPTE